VKNNLNNKFHQLVWMLILKKVQLII